MNAGLPAALIFYDRELPAELRGVMDDLARQYAGRILVVILSKGDAAQAVSRFGVHQFPGLVAVRDGKTVSTAEGLRPEDLKPHIDYTLGEGPQPTPRRVTHPQTSSKSPSSSRPVAVGETDFDREVLHAEEPVLVDFWAPWCSPCHMVAPTLEALAREKGDSLKVAKVNVDENPGLAARYGAMSIPTMIVIKDGREVDRWVGALPDKAIRSRVARWV